MKRAIVTFLALIMFYPTCGRVISVTADDVVTVRLYSGYEYAFYGDDYVVGDVVAMIMNDCGTDLIFDDEVVAAQYVVIPD